MFLARKCIFNALCKCRSFADGAWLYTVSAGVIPVALLAKERKAMYKRQKEVVARKERQWQLARQRDGLHCSLGT